MFLCGAACCRIAGRNGASPAATASFLLSTPQTGIDSLVITYALLGTVFAIYRPIVALATGLLGGLFVMLFDRSNGNSVAAPTAACHECCCADKESKGAVRRAIEYGFVTLPRDIGLALLVGVVIAGAITALAPKPGELQPYLGGGILSIFLMMALGTHQRLRLGVGPDCGGPNPPGGLAGSGVCVPDLRAGDECRHDYHGLEIVGRPGNGALPLHDCPKCRGWRVTARLAHDRVPHSSAAHGRARPRSHGRPVALGLLGDSAFGCAALFVFATGAQ